MKRVPRLSVILGLSTIFLLASACDQGPDTDAAAGGEDGAPEVESGMQADAAGSQAGTDTWNPAHRAGDPLAQPQAWSFFGDELHAMEDTDGVVAAADSLLAQDPDDVELLIHAARERRHVWHYRQAMELYARAAELAPDDWRPLRFKGHRHISVREFDQAIEALESARELAPLNWDVSYHLGLAYFLSGRFEDAATEYMRCFDLADSEEARQAEADGFRACSANEDDPESMVAMTEWLVRSLQRAGHGDEARAVLDALPESLPIETNVAYLHNLDLYRGLRTEDELLNPGEDAPYRLETVGFGVANYRLAQGDVDGARQILELLMEDPFWPGFGRIAAETELARLDGILPDTM